MAYILTLAALQHSSQQVQEGATMLEIVLLQNTIMTKLYLPFQGTFIYQSCMLLNYFKQLTNSKKLNTQLLYINK